MRSLISGIGLRVILRCMRRIRLSVLDWMLLSCIV